MAIGIRFSHAVLVFTIALMLQPMLAAARRVVETAPSPALAFADALGHAACSQQVGAWIERTGGPVSEVFEDAPEVPGERIFNLPTGKIGVWLRVTFSSASAPVGARISPAGVEEQRWSGGCDPLPLHRTAAATTGAGFTDADLRRVASGGWGVVYVWSPHMPLSIDAYQHAANAARDLELPIIVLLDPFADLDYARRAAETHGLPTESLRRSASIELAFRGMTIHAPSLLVFGNGRVIGPVLPGYREAAAYRAFIEEQLRAGRR